MADNSTVNKETADDTPTSISSVEVEDNSLLCPPDFKTSSMAKPVRKWRYPAASVHFPRKVEDPACGPTTTSILTVLTVLPLPVSVPVDLPIPLEMANRRGRLKK
ncbi:hypothetical protein C0J52_20342 [Blattella germanica]|nr:hypothetical protein C0J52_20342 [Blattella germanica]